MIKVTLTAEFDDWDVAEEAARNMEEVVGKANGEIDDVIIEEED